MATHESARERSRSRSPDPEPEAAREGQGKHWQFTVNNPSDADRRKLCDLGADSGRCSYLIYGEEVGASGTPHLQGHVSFVAKTRFRQVKALLPDGAHLELVRLLQRHIDYCKKDGAFTEFGTPPTREASGSGLRTDLAAFRAAVESGVTDSPTLREEHPIVMARFPVFARSVISDVSPTPTCPRHTLHAWQRLVLEFLAEPVHPRKILFVVDERGNQGKTYLTNYVSSRYEKVQIMQPGRLQDMSYIYREQTKILLIDVPRSRTEHLQYSFLEAVKDGRLFSTKYESRMKTFMPPHVVVFMNEEPDMTALSADRYKYIIIN